MVDRVQQVKANADSAEGFSSDLKNVAAFPPSLARFRAVSHLPSNSSEEVLKYWLSMFVSWNALATFLKSLEKNSETPSALLMK